MQETLTDVYGPDIERWLKERTELSIWRVGIMDAHADYLAWAGRIVVPVASQNMFSRCLTRLGVKRVRSNVVWIAGRVLKRAAAI